MDIKDLISFVGLALLVTFGLQYFTGRSSDQNQADFLSGQKMVAPRGNTQVPELNKPLNTEVDFLDSEQQLPEEVVVVDTPLMAVHFSNHGAVVHSLAFKRMQGDKTQEFKTLESDPAARTHGAFLLALN
ncbi:MAG: hypothetical protein ABUT20_63205, partial [Bacteroidota bacterium]